MNEFVRIQNLFGLVVFAQILSPIKLPLRDLFGRLSLVYKNNFFGALLIVSAANHDMYGFIRLCWPFHRAALSSISLFPLFTFSSYPYECYGS